MKRSIYFDYNATTPLDPRVLEAMMPYLTEHFGNASSVSHTFGLAAAAAVDRARTQVAALLGASPGEILFTSMDADGTQAGYELTITRRIADAVPIPVIASGGAGTLEHIYDGVTQGKAEAALVASLVHYNILTIRQMKEYLRDRGVPVRL